MDFQKAKEKFFRLQEQGLLPPKVEAKLALLLQGLSGEQLVLPWQISRQQAESLLALSEQDHTLLFCSICQGVKTRGRGFTVRKDRLLSSWRNAKLILKETRLEVQTDKHQFAYPKEHLDQAITAVRRDGKHWVMAIKGRDLPSIIIRSQTQMPLQNWREKIMAFVKNQAPKSRSGSLIESAVEEQQDQNISQEQEELFPQGEQDFCDELLLQQDFSLLQMREDLRILQHHRLPLLKATLLLEGQSLQPLTVLSAIHFQNLWNPMINNSTVIMRVDSRSVTIHEQHRASSMLSLSRDFILLRRSFVKDDVSVLYDQDAQLQALSSQANNSGMSTIRGNMPRRIWAVLKHSQSNKLVLIVLLECRLNGLTSTQNSIEYSHKLLREITNINKYLQHHPASISSPLPFAFQRQQIIPKKISSKEKRKTALKTIKQETTHHKQKKEIIDQRGITSISLKKPHFQAMPELMENNSHWMLPFIKFQPQKINWTFYSKQPGPNHSILNTKWGLKDGVLCFIDEDHLRKQKQIFKIMLKKIGSALLAGKSIINMSLPVLISDKLTILQRIAIRFSYCSLIGSMGVQAPKPKQVAIAALFVLAKSRVGMGDAKPFNPILGQTFQAVIPGAQICLEQVSHHPPISSFYVAGEGFRHYGNQQVDVRMKFNQVVFELLRCSYLQFEGAAPIEQYLCGMSIQGIIYGDRLFQPSGSFFSIMPEEKLVCEITIGTAPSEIHGLPADEKKQLKNNSVVGSVFKCSDEGIARIRAEKYRAKLKPQDIKSQILHRIRGKWSDAVYLDEKQIFGPNQPPLPQMQYINNPLPSDSIFRLDRHFWILEDADQAQDHKQRMQEDQRRDRTLRAKHKA